MENYKEKYEHALETIKKIKNANIDNKKLVDFIEYEYPQLKDSDDERIRKELIKFIKSEYGEEAKKEWIDYLEKKKEQVWSDNDEYYKQAIIKDLNGLYSMSSVEQYKDLLLKEMEWFDKLPERFVLQPEIKWTQKDDYIYKNIYSLVKENIIDPNKKQWIEECLNWLVSFKEKLTNK